MGHVTQLSNRQARAAAHTPDPSSGGGPPVGRPLPGPALAPGPAVAQRQHVSAILASARRHLESLEAQRRLFVLSRSLSLAQV